MKRRMSSIPLMLEYVSGLASHPGDRSAVERILAHEDYQFELRRYGIPSAAHLIDYFSRLTTISPEEIPDLSDNHRRNFLREKHGEWLDCVQNPQKYEDRCHRTEELFTDGFLADMQRRLTALFPKGTGMIPDPAVVSTLSFGRSFGYAHEGALHLDLFGIERCCSLEDLPRIVLHGKVEVEHPPLRRLQNPLPVKPVPRPLRVAAEPEPRAFHRTSGERLFDERTGHQGDLVEQHAGEGGPLDESGASFIPSPKQVEPVGPSAAGDFDVSA